MKKFRIFSTLSCILFLAILCGEKVQAKGGNSATADVATDVVIVIGDVMVDMADSDLVLLSELDQVIGIISGTEEHSTLVTPSLEWLGDRVDDYNDILYREETTTGDDIFRMSIMKTTFSGLAHNWKENAITKKLTAIWGETKAGKAVDLYSKAQTVTSTIDGIMELKEIIKSDDADKALQIYLELGDMLSDISDGNIVWEFNSNSWNYLRKTEQYQKFLTENEDNFGKAFWKATWDGCGECVKDLPREINSIAKNLSGMFQKEENMKLPLIERIAGSLKPSNQVNVYKPNIYFYSEVPLQISVEFVEEHLLTKMIPEYSMGWNVMVHGDGKLTCQDNTYDFLFYESLASESLVDKGTGWIIYEDARREQLLEILSLYDFNEQETVDFMDFWMEMLDEDTNYIMYPQNTECVDLQMPVEIQPEPAAITRIWFGFEKYDGQRVETPKVTPINREGFTVVEWGGFFLD